MKQGRSLPALAEELRRQAERKRDYLAEAWTLSAHSTGSTDTSSTALVLSGTPYPIGEVAHGQLAEYLGIPKGYYDRLRHDSAGLRTFPSGRDADGLPLFDVTVNTLLGAKGNDRRLVRTLDGKARAFLSASYSLDLDHFDVFRIAAKAVEEVGLCPDDVASCEVTETRLYLKVLSPRLTAEVKPENLKSAHGLLREPQVVQGGFLLTNSEVGLGALKVQQFVYRLACTNGWVIEEVVKQRHIGRTLEADDSREVYRDDTRLADARAKLLKLRDHIAAALDEHRFRRLVDRIDIAAGAKMEGKVEAVVEVTARRLGLNQHEKEETLRHLIAGADLTAWGLSNAVTRAAQDAPSYDRATALEAAGGRLLTLPAPELRELLRAE